MMRIMLIDDEPLFIEQVKKKLALYSSELGVSFEVVAECYSGNEALELIPICQPEVVFSDIRMASLDGIELAKLIQLKWPALPVVIISGYPSFEYVREAMRANVIDYLLKPIDSAALKEILQKLIHERRRRDYEKSKKALQSILRSRSVQEIPDEIHRLFQNYKAYRAVFIQNASFYSDPLILTHLEIEHVSLRQQLAPFLGPNDESWFMSLEEGKFILLVIASHNKGPEKLPFILSHAQTFFSKQDVLPSIYYSESFRQLNQIGNIVKQLHQHFSERRVIGKPKIAEVTNATWHAHEQFTPLEEKRLIYGLTELQRQGLRPLISSFIEAWDKNDCPCMRVEMYLKRIVILLEQYIRTVDARQSKESEHRIEEIVSFSSSFAELEEAFWSMISGLFDLRDAEDELRDPAKLFEKIETFINTNIGQPITLQVLMDKFHVSSTYLCNLFREFSGKSFVEYITTLRIKKAQAFMQAYPDALNKEIAQILGYTDQNYFSRVFKSIVGISPTEYKASLLR